MGLVDNQDFVFYLVLHLIRSKHVVDKIRSILQPDDFNRREERAYRMLWAISRDWYNAQKSLIPREYLTLEVKSRIGDSFATISKEEEQEIWNSIETIYAASEDLLVPEKMLEYAQQFLSERRVKPTLQRLGSMDVDDLFDGEFSKLQKEHGATRLSKAKSCDYLFTPGAVELEQNFVFTPTGVQYLDALMPGIAPGKSYGILGPSGGGKTTIGGELAVAVARQRKYVAYFSYEVPVVPELRNRIYGCAGLIPRDILRDIKHLKDMPEQYKQTLNEQLGIWGQYIKMRDVTGSAGASGAEGIRAELDALASAGEHVEVVIIDQLMSMVDIWIGANNEDFSNRRVLMQHIVEEIRSLTGPMNCCTFILHQVDTKVKGASPSRRPRKGDAMEDKSFDNNMHFCIQLGTADTKGCCWLADPKARDDQERAIVVRRSPLFWRFDYTPGKYIATRDGFVAQSEEEHSRDIISIAEVERSRRFTAEDLEGGDNYGR